MTLLPRSFLLVCALVAASSLAACGGGGGRASVTPGVMPPGETMTGVYQSPQYGEMHVVQTGAQVVAEYTHDERRGRLQGTAQGNLLRFDWTERRELVVGRPNITRGRGYFQFTREADGSFYLLGEWGHDDNETGGGPWRSVRLRNRRPQLSSGSGGSSGSEDSAGEPEGDDLDSPGSGSYGSGSYDSGSGRSGSGRSGTGSGSGSRGSDDLGDL
jgi:hypothetical protein